uniref:Uncharacterized protein n=1 Tax=Arundo donax TaxID=35708 RepID=A0A0A9F0L3_ARUDO
MGTEIAPQVDAGRRFILDSGSSVHATGDWSLLKETRAPGRDDATSITRRDGKEMGVVAVGSILTLEFDIDDVLLVPELGPGRTVVSVSKLAALGCAVMFVAAGCLVVDGAGAVVGEGRMLGDEDEEGLYRLSFLRIPSSSRRTDPPDPYPARSVPPAASTAAFNRRTSPTNACS